VTDSDSGAAVATVTTTSGNPYPTGSHNGGPGERFPVLPFAALAFIVGIALVVVLRRRGNSVDAR
jgi:hypothetical protein